MPFCAPVDEREAPGYYDAIPFPMCLDQLLSRLGSGMYGGGKPHTKTKTKTTQGNLRRTKDGWQEEEKKETEEEEDESSLNSQEQKHEQGHVHEPNQNSDLAIIEDADFRTSFRLHLILALVRKGSISLK